MQLLDYHTILGIIATIIGLAGFVPYFRDIIKKSIKPHAFSWLIWGILQAVVFFAQTSKGGGAGAWAIGAPAALNLIIAGIALFRGDKNITLVDKASLLLALFGVLLWVLTSNPLWSVAIASGVDVIGFIPTIRKAYRKPREESITVYACTGISFFISIFALQSINLTTVLYPISVMPAIIILISVILLGRRKS